MIEERVEYHAGPTDGAEPPLTTEDLVALAHQRHQGIPYLTGEPLLDRLPEWLRDLADHILSGKATTGEVAYALAALIEAIEGRSDRTGSAPALTQTGSHSGGYTLRDNCGSISWRSGARCSCRSG